MFLSHTSELRKFPHGASYIAAAEQAISAAGHVAVNMASFPAGPRPPAQVCAERVRECDVYVGVLGTRYGSPVRDRRDVSYTELEFETATDAELDRLVFLLDEDADELGIPPSALIDRKFGARQDAFRRRVQGSGLTTQSFASPAELGQLLERSLRDLADTRARLASGIRREQVPAEPKPVRASKFVNPPPTVTPTWFQGRQAETRLLARYVADPAIRLVTVTGRGGVGKTALACRFLKGLETGRIPDVDAASALITVGGIVYLSRNGAHQVDYPTLTADLLRLLPADEAQRLRRLSRDPHRTRAELMLALLEAFPAGDPVVVLLDNLESAMDAERETLVDQELYQALNAVLVAPVHAVTVITTTRVLPTDLFKVEPARQRQLRLDEGLGSADAQIVLRELDDDGRLGLRDAPEELLDELWRHTRGFPRALEAVKAILDSDATLSPRDLLDRTRHLPEDQVVQVLVGEAYDLLDPAAQQVMQALAVFPAPVSAVGVDFLLRAVHPTTDSASILARLVRRQLAQFQDGHYALHPVDREYARGQLAAGHPGDSPAAFTLTRLQARAADYYAQIRTPRESWRRLEDVRPQLAEFDLRCDTGDYDTAAVVLDGIDYDYLQVWGHYRTLVELHERIRGRVDDPALNARHLRDLGLCHNSLGEYRRAIDLHTQALAIAREIGDREGEAGDLGNLGVSHDSLGEYRRAIDLQTEALVINREIGYREGEANDLGNLAVCYHSQAEYWRAIELQTEALVIDREIGYREGEANDLGNLGICYDSLGEVRRAIDLHNQALVIDREIGYRRGEADDLGNLGLCYQGLGEVRRAIDLHTQALAIAREIGYRQDEANELCYLGRAWLASGDPHQAVKLLEQAVGVADAIGDVEPAAEARSWLARARLELGDPAAALAAATSGRELPYPREEPTLCLLQGVALLELHRVEESVPAFGDAVRTADALLVLAASNVAASQARALGLSGLAVVTDDPVRAAEAAEAFTQSHAAMEAVGVAAETRRLLDRIAGHDRSGVLTVVRAAG